MFGFLHHNNSEAELSNTQTLDKKVDYKELKSLDTKVAVDAVYYFFGKKLSENEIIEILDSVNRQKPITEKELEVFKNAGAHGDNILFNKEQQQIFTSEELGFRNKFKEFFLEIRMAA